MLETTRPTSGICPVVELGWTRGRAWTEINSVPCNNQRTASLLAR